MSGEYQAGTSIEEDGFAGRIRHVYLEGRLQTRKWKGTEGEMRTTTEIVANQMQILDRAPKDGNGAKGAGPSKLREPADENDNPFDEPGSGTTDQDIPY